MERTVEAEADKGPERLDFDPFVEFVPGRGVPPQQPKIETYTVEEVAKMLSVCEQTVRRYIRAGELEAWQLGQLYRIPKYALFDYLELCRHKVSAGPTMVGGHRVEPLLTPKEIQKILRIGTFGFRTLVRSGRLPVVRLGKEIRVRPAALRVWLDSRDRCQKVVVKE